MDGWDRSPTDDLYVDELFERSEIAILATEPVQVRYPWTWCVAKRSSPQTATWHRDETSRRLRKPGTLTLAQWRRSHQPLS